MNGEMIDPNLNQNLNPVQLPKVDLPGFFKKPEFWVVAGIALAVLILVVTIIFPMNKSGIQSKVSPRELPVIVKQADKGKLLEGFISGLIVDKNAVITGSAENGFKSGFFQNTTALVTSYDTKLSIDVLKQKYSDYFKSNNWTTAPTQPASLEMAASKADVGSVQISFVKGSGKNSVIVLLILANTNK
jgi:hypothetical protein